MEQIRVMLVDDHSLFRQGLRRVLEHEAELSVVGEVSNGTDAITQAATLKPDIILMDINLGSMNGLQVTREIKGAHPEIGILILTAYHDEEQLLHAIRAGASAYYPKDVVPERLVEGIREVSRGNYVINDEVLGEPQMAAWLLKQFEEMTVYGESSDEMFVPLSPREMEILVYITKGYSNKEIAYTLGISRQTVKNHMTSILRKLAVNDRTQAAVYALRHGWIRLQDTKYDRS